MYAEGLRAAVRLNALTVDGKLPFVFEASGSETHFTNGYDPEPRSRQIFFFPQPSTLAKLLRAAEADSHSPTWRGKVRGLSELDTSALRPAQITAINGIEKSLVEQRFARRVRSRSHGPGSPARRCDHGGLTSSACLFFEVWLISRSGIEPARSARRTLRLYRRCDVHH